MSLAIFDLDNTLIGGDSDHGWGEFMVTHGLVDAEAYRKANDQFYRDYENGQLDLQAYLEFSLAPLAAHSMEDLLSYRNQFLEEVISPLILPKAIDLLKKHKNEGDYLLIITSTNDFITTPIAEKLGVDHLLATQTELTDNRYTGRITGTPCFREGKIERLESWLKDAEHYGYRGTNSGATFYSDSINDLPLLDWVDNPIAVDPDPQLESVAIEKGWPVISLR